jgi:hypothetical protein
VQAGLMAGMAVAVIFFVIDLARMTPLSTPLFLYRSLVQVSLELDSQELARRLADLSPGGRLGALTAVHLSVSTVFGVLAAALSNLFNVRWSARTGAAAGLLVGLVAWLGATQAGPVWLAEAYLTPEIMIGAGVVGGAVLGWHLRLSHIDAEDDRARNGR